MNPFQDNIQSVRDHLAVFEAAGATLERSMDSGFNVHGAMSALVGAQVNLRDTLVQTAVALQVEDPQFRECVQVEIFSEPTGGVRGIVTATSPSTGDRIAKALLRLDNEASISFSMPTDVNPNDLSVLTAVMLQFADAVARNS